MTFLNFGALFGLAAVSIPIIIHLLNKMQVREMAWAAMRFLQESIEKNQRRLQMEDILLLLLRCLLVALLVLVLSRPTWQSKSITGGSHQVTAVLIIDNSYSMGMTNGIQTRLERAQAAAEQILQAFPTGSSSALYFAADDVQPVIAQPTYDFNLLRKTIREAKLTDRSTDLTNALQMAVATLQKEGSGSKEIYLITDGQANGWPAMDQLKQQLAEIQKQIVVHLVLVGDAAESNLGVTGLRVESGLTPVNQQLRCAVDVLNGSDTEVRDVRVSLMVDDQPAGDEQIIPSIMAGATGSVSLFAKLRTEGYHTITAKIPHDRLPADDQRTVAVRAISDVKVLLVQGGLGQRGPQADDFFVRNALVPVAPAGVADYFIKTTTIPASQLAMTSLDSYDAVFLLNVDSLEAGTVDPIVNYVKQGGGLVIFPGTHSDPSYYNEKLGAGGFLPARLGFSKGQPDQQAKFFTLQTKDYDNPITTLWNDPTVGTLTQVHFAAYYQLTPRPWKEPAKDEPTPLAGQPRVVLHFANSDDPVAVEQTWGSGRVIMFSSTATTAWNDFPVHPAFVPFMQRVLGALVEREDEGLNVRVGQKFSYSVSNDLLNKDVSVVVPGQTDPPRVSGQVSLVNGLPVVQFSDTNEAGAYRVIIGNSPGTILYFAAQSDPAESNLTPLSDEQLKSLSDVADIIKWNPNVDLTPKLTAARVGRELWWPLLIAALVIATIETFLAQRFTQSK